MRDYAISPYAIADKYSPRSLVQTMILVHPLILSILVQKTTLKWTPCPSEVAT